jgi:hypothetical protein
MSIVHSVLISPILGITSCYVGGVESVWYIPNLSDKLPNEYESETGLSIA